MLALQRRLAYQTMKVLYIAAVATPAYRARHGMTGLELGGDRKAQLSLDG